MHRFVIPLILICAFGQLACAQTLTRGSLQSGSITRTYALRIPTNYSPEKTYPLLLLLHGRLGTGQGTLDYTEFGKLADAQELIVVCPDGYKKSWNDGRADTPAHQAQVDDVAFLSALLDKIGTSHTIDSRRIYCAGMSNGGFMTLTLASKIGERFAAIAVVTASLPEIAPETHLPVGNLPLLILNGTDDPLVKYSGGQITRRSPERILATPDFAALYAKRLACTNVATVDQADPQNDGTSTSVTTWSGCSEGSELQLWAIKGGGHTWPGKKQYLNERFIGRTSRDFDGSVVIWAFLSRWAKAQ